MRVTMYFHPSCATSRQVIVGLDRAGLLDGVELVPILDGSKTLKLGVWSVPWVIIDGRPAVTDPTDADEVIAALKGGRPDVGDEVEAFMNAVLHSSFATTVSLLHGSISPVVDVDFVSAAVRAPLTGNDPRQIASRLAGDGARLFSEWRDKLRRAAAVSFVRELYWASNGDVTPDQVVSSATPAMVGAWLIAKASVGRGALPARPHGAAREDAEWIASFVSRAARGLLEKVKEEQTEIYGDSRYLRILESLGISIPP